MKAKIYYHDIGDYLSQQEKLKIVKNFKSITNLPFVELHPNAAGDWINERNESFDAFIPLAPEKKFDLKTQSFFIAQSNGVLTAKDSWLINSAKIVLENNIKNMLSFYNEQRILLHKAKTEGNNSKIDKIIKYDSSRISWSDLFLRDAEKNIPYNYINDSLYPINYRPFNKQHLSYDKKLIQRTYQMVKLFPNGNDTNLLICISCKSSTKGISVSITDSIVDYHYNGDTQCFPLYYYEERQKQTQSLFDTAESGTSEYVRRDAISDFILVQAKERYGKNVSKEDLFYYVYGLLHSNEYRETFANDLKKMLPRLPLLEDVREFWAFSKAGRALAELHLNYENQPSAAGVIVIHNPLTITDIMQSLSEDEIKYIDYKVEKMKFAKKDKKDDKTIIYYNNRISIENIPAKAYDYVVNGKSAIEWIMERYAITTHPASQITNNPNDWAEEVGNPKYILDLLLSVINVSVQTVDIVEGLPKVKF